jgi:hypothetical protein
VGSGWGGDYPMREMILPPGPALSRLNSSMKWWRWVSGRWNSGGELTGDRGEGARVARAHGAIGPPCSGMSPPWDAAEENGNTTLWSVTSYCTVPVLLFLYGTVHIKRQYHKRLSTSTSLRHLSRLQTQIIQSTSVNVAGRKHERK